MIGLKKRDIKSQIGTCLESQIDIKWKKFYNKCLRVYSSSKQRKG